MTLMAANESTHSQFAIIRVIYILSLSPFTQSHSNPLLPILSILSKKNQYDSKNRKWPIKYIIAAILHILQFRIHKNSRL